MRLLILAALLAFSTDQASKYGVLHGLGLAGAGRIEIWPPVLVFIDSLNTGINFGLFSGAPDAARWIMIGVAAAISAAVALWAARSFARPVEFASAGLLIGGALGNAVDRVIHGGVIDFLNMSCCGITNPFVFNVADIWVFAGAIGLAVFTGREDTPTGSV
jgi:signal peptidase II